MNSTVEFTAQVARLIRAPAPKVWTALTKPAALKQFFFGADVTTTWKVGSPIHLQGVFEGQAYEDEGEILAFERHRQLSFSHGNTLPGDPDSAAACHVVTFDLEPDGAGTQVTLSLSNRDGEVSPSDLDRRAENEKNWTAVLDRLARTLP